MFATVTAWSYGIAGVIYLVFALSTAGGKARGVRVLTLIWAAAATAVWGLSVLAFTFTGQGFLLRLSGLADLMAYAGWYAVLLFLGDLRLNASGDKDGRSYWLLPVAVAVVGWGVAAHVLAIMGVFAFGDPSRILLYVSLAAAILGLVLVEQVFRNVTVESRWSITPFCVGLGAAFAFDIYTFADGLLFSRIDGDMWMVRGIVRSLALSLIVISLVRARGEKFRIVLSRQLMFRSTALAVSGVYLLFMAAAGYYVRYFGGQWGRALQVAVVFAGMLLLVVLVFSGSIRAKLRVTVSKHFFPYLYDYREEWLRFTQALSTHTENSAMGRQVIQGLANMVESPAGALWMRDAQAHSFVPTAQWNMPAGEPEDAASDLMTFIASSGWVINIEEFRSAPDRYGQLRLPAWLSAIGNAWLVVPLSIGNELTGFVLLATARTALEVNWEVNDLLKTAGRQAATFLGHIQATEALLEARKFEAFNRLSAFVVHDLKNIVAQLSLMLRNAERHHGNPEFQQDMLMTVEHSVSRMKQLMLQLRDGTTPLDVTHRTELVELARRVQRSKAGQRPTVEIEFERQVATKCHEDRLERVVGHLVQNALDATDADGRVWIKIAQQSEQAVVEVGDTGHGMTPEFVRDRLFKPFQTTKPTGMGIGAYESHQYVHELGGRVLVESTPNVGTRVRLSLPLFPISEGVQRDFA